MNADDSETRNRDPYRELFERSADAILIIEGETFVDCNDATVELLRYDSKEELLQTHPSELSPPTQPDGRDSFEKANEIMAIAFERGSHRFEWDHKRADGDVFPVEVLLTAIEEPGRRTLHVVWRDISERKHLEEQLRQSLKMEAIGKLTGGIAHDFNNLLVVVLGHAGLLADLLSDQPEALEHVEQIRSAGGQAADLVRQLLAFGRKQQLLPAALDLNTLITEMTILLQRVLGEEISLVPRLTDEAVPVKADRGQLSQVLINLAANARDAMPEGGELVIETARVLRTSADVDAGFELPEGEYATLTVSDTGSGMDAETQEHAFDPFFTTKEAGRGTGLGLATVYGIVVQSGGAVSLKSRVGEGTRVELVLPLTAERVRVPAEEQQADPSSAGEGETILVVEDQPAVADLVVSALDASGYRLLVASNGLEALELYQQDHVDLIVTDVIMPKMNGPRLIAELRRLGHDPAVLFMSGYTNEGLNRLHDFDQDVDVLRKPFEVADLTMRVKRALRRGTGARKSS